MKSNFGQDFGAHLRGLRLILGADNKPISGERFFELTGILPGTIHSIETNRRRLSEADAKRIKNRLGAKWNSKKGRWVCRWDESKPYSHESYEQYVNHIVSDEQNRQLAAEALMRPLFYMLQRLPQPAYIQALFELHDELSALAARLQAPSDVMEVLEYLKPGVEIETMRDGKNREMLLASMIYPDHKKVAAYFTPNSAQSVRWQIRLDAAPEFKKLLKKGPPSRR